MTGHAECHTLKNGKKIPGMGEFAFQPIVGAFQPTLESMANLEPMMGMDPEGLYLWGTLRDEDGTLEAGHFLIGNDLMGFAITTNEKEEVRFTYDVDCEVTFGPDNYWHTGIKAKVFGEDYEFIPDPRGRMPELGPIPNPQLDGRWRKVGDTREPDVWFAWGESASAHGAKPVQRLPGVGQRIITPLDRFSRDY